MVMYMLLTGRPPFRGESELEVMRKSRGGTVHFTGEFHLAADWTGVSVPAKELISMMLTVDMDVRPTASKVLTHPWLHQYPDPRFSSPETDKAILRRFERFRVNYT